MSIKTARWQIQRHTIPDRASYIPQSGHDRLNPEEIATYLAITSNEFACWRPSEDLGLSACTYWLQSMSIALYVIALGKSNRHD